ncbi:DUF4112 domain-containing protein [Engelhardtia mirabilis]|uniref:DUF4112 domain-containing protein n=1 Tax=Engelhardtia mirabilis TaxID=2528011 RepID=A0A518BEF7_9BACT|nr:hypothetical protein Pla133_04250 [Planctomycetes bacterium Pla133]QDU99686.1 hypothetical protein Pla86_04250 [Planctomycetes bacterium Pla86]
MAILNPSGRAPRSKAATAGEENSDLVTARLARLRKYARLLDSSVGLPGTRFRVGVDSLVGLIPGVGDAVGMVLSTPILLEAWRLGAPRRVQRRMVANIALESLVGIIPIAGDLFDAWFKANLRNIALLEAELRRSAPATQGRIIDVPSGAGGRGSGSVA